MGSLVRLSHDSGVSRKLHEAGETMHKITGRALPTVAAIHAEAARVEAMIAASAQRLESAPADPRSAMHLQVCRAELHAYLAGLLYSLGQPDGLKRQVVGRDPFFTDVEVVNYQEVADDEEPAPRFTECFEC
jgi:hypothetical protein